VAKSSIGPDWDSPAILGSGDRKEPFPWKTSGGARRTCPDPGNAQVPRRVVRNPSGPCPGMPFRPALQRARTRPFPDSDHGTTRRPARHLHDRSPLHNPRLCHPPQACHREKVGEDFCFSVSEGCRTFGMGTKKRRAFRPSSCLIGDQCV